MFIGRIIMTDEPSNLYSYSSLHAKMSSNKYQFYSTVKPVLRGHPWDKEKVAL